MACISVAATALVPPANAAAGTPATQPPAVSLYVSPSQGRDNWPGTQAHPFRTLERARTQVRRINQDMHRDIHVEMLSGIYELTDTFELTGADSGTNGHRVVYEAA